MPTEKRDIALRKTFGRKLREAREKRGLSIEKFSFLSGTEIRNLRNYEEGIRCPAMPKARALARLLGVSVDWLLSDDEEDFKVVLSKQIDALRKLVLENCASENATQELLVERGLATKEELATREEKYKSELDIAFAATINIY